MDLPLDDLACVAAVVLAAGAGSRFGGGKLLARLEGRPLLQHTLEAVRATGVAPTVVVLGADAREVERRIPWTDEARVVNPRPEAGLAGSLRLGVTTVLALAPDPCGVLVVLGDQPRTSTDAIRRLVGALSCARAAGAWAVVPDYADGGGSNPALLLPTGLAQTSGLEGDRGLGPLLSAHPDRVVRVAVPGSNPDVDTRADLARLAGRPRP